MTTPASQDHLEVEWQFQAVDVRPVARWLETAALGSYRAAPTGTKELDDRYIDTADWRLHRAGYTCRIRHKGESAELTLKAMAEADAGLRMRRELTDSLAGPGIDEAVTSPGPAGEALRAVTGRSAVRELFRLHTTRKLYALSDLSGPVGEVALDETSIPLEGEDVPIRISRVEVEVPQEVMARARPFLDQFVAGCALTPATTSKFEAALLATGTRIPPVAQHFGTTDVTAAMTAAETAFAILRKHYLVFLQNEPGTRLGEDIEALHDMRVATRRMRAAMQAFRPFLSNRMEGFRAEFGWVGRVLGEVRDLDVQLERLAEWEEALGHQAVEPLEALAEILRARRRVARRRMLTALDSRRHESLLERFSAYLQRGPARSYAPGRQSILSAAPDLVEKRYRTLRKRGDRIGPGSPAADYHTLRIDGKKLRYALEFVGPVYGAPATDFARAVTRLQDVLGLHQDAEVARETLAGIAATHRRLSPDTLMAMGMVAERYRTHAIELRADFPGVYEKLKGRPWRRLRTAMEKRRPTPLARSRARTFRPDTRRPADTSLDAGPGAIETPVAPSEDPEA